MSVAEKDTRQILPSRTCIGRRRAAALPGWAPAGRDLASLGFSPNGSKLVTTQLPAPF